MRSESAIPLPAPTAMGRPPAAHRRLGPMTLFGLGIALVLLSPALWARGVYLEPTEFLDQVFQRDPPAPKRIWITKARRRAVTEILGHRPPSLRLPYWRKGGRIAWVLDEIGKEQPITLGIVVRDGVLEQVRVLAFRESRGGEIRHPFFTDQFPGTGLDAEGHLDRTIDGISGATLSVRAVDRVARLALYLSRGVIEQGP